jgi:nicotinate-nucleotide adenylyltransferase
LSPLTYSRVGLYGGAFDPPHTGHLALANCAIEQLQLDRLYVLPTGHAWHKTRSLTAAHHRLAMTQQNFENCDKVTVDDREIRREGPTYTIDTLNELKESHSDAEFFIVMGADQAQQFQTWKYWQQIASHATLAVAQRPSSTENLGWTDEWHNQNLIKTIRLNMPIKMVSATDIRSRIRQGALPTEDLKPAVSQYIQQHHLYLEPHD